MNGTHELSRLSTASSGVELVIQHGDPSCLTMLGGLYQKLEPQMTKSYRPNVVYIPPSKPTTPEQQRRVVGKAANMQRRKGKLKAASIIISTVSEIKRKSDDPGDPDTQTNMKKDGSQSLPNLANPDS